MTPKENFLLSLVRKQVVAHYGEAWFLRQWAWPNPDAGHLRLKLPRYAGASSAARKMLDLRIRPASECLEGAALPDHLRPDVALVGCWFFDGAEQVAMTDFWILVLEGPAHNQSPTCVVLPTLTLLGYLRGSADAGRLYLYFTPEGECYASPSPQTEFAALRERRGPRCFSSRYYLSSHLNAWYLLAGSDGD